MSEVREIDCTTDEYHLRKEYSNSQAKLLPHDPVLFARRHITKEFPHKPTASQKLGTAVHRILLDGDEVLEIPDAVLAKNRAKAGNAWHDFEREHKDKILVKPGDAWDDNIRHMIASVRAVPKAMRLLEDPGWTEKTLIYRDEETGLPLRTRPDRIVKFGEGLVIPDLKSTKDPLRGDRHFGREIADLDYHRQAAWYTDAVLWWMREPVLAFAFIAVRNKPPYECVIHDLDEEDIEQGRRENRAALDELKRRLDSGDWNLPYHNEIVPLRLPRWRRDEENRN